MSSDSGKASEESISRVTYEVEAQEYEEGELSILSTLQVFKEQKKVGEEIRAVRILAEKVDHQIGHWTTAVRKANSSLF